MFRYQGILHGSFADAASGRYGCQFPYVGFAWAQTTAENLQFRCRLWLTVLDDACESLEGRRLHPSPLEESLGRIRQAAMASCFRSPPTTCIALEDAYLRGARCTASPLFENYSPCPPRQLTGRLHFAITALCGPRTRGTVNQTRREP
jgi:hypothetical protein